MFIDEVKLSADVVIGTNDEDGIAYYLEYYVFKHTSAIWFIKALWYNFKYDYR